MVSGRGGDGGRGQGSGVERVLCMGSCGGSGSCKSGGREGQGKMSMGRMRRRSELGGGTSDAGRWRGKDHVIKASREASRALGVGSCWKRRVGQKCWYGVLERFINHGRNGGETEQIG